MAQRHRGSIDKRLVIRLVFLLMFSATLSRAQVPYPFQDGFESGTYSNWTVGTGSYTRTVTNSTAASGTYSFTQTGGNVTHFNGVSASFATWQKPLHVSFSVRAASTSTAAGYVVLANGTNDVIWFYLRDDAHLYVNDTSSMTTHYLANTWYNIRLELNWTAYTVDFYINNTLAKSGIAFRAHDSINTIHLYNYTSGSQAWWDDISVDATADTNIPRLIPVTPDPTSDTLPWFTWHALAGNPVYTLEVDTNRFFNSPILLQQLRDTAFQPLWGLPRDTIYWRVRSSTGSGWSLVDQFIILSDSVPVIIPVSPETLATSFLQVFRWHRAPGTTNYKIELDSCGPGLLTPLTITYTTDTFFTLPLTLSTGRYCWWVTGGESFNYKSTVDTFWVDPSSADENNGGGVPPAFSLHNNQPNPGHPHTLIAYALPRECGVELAVFNMQGRQVRRLVNRLLPAGCHQAEWNGRTEAGNTLPSGVYFYRFRAWDRGSGKTVFTQTEKMVLLQ